MCYHCIGLCSYTDELLNPEKKGFDASPGTRYVKPALILSLSLCTHEQISYERDKTDPSAVTSSIVLVTSKNLPVEVEAGPVHTATLVSATIR